MSGRYAERNGTPRSVLGVRDSPPPGAARRNGALGLFGPAHVFVNSVGCIGIGFYANTVLVAASWHLPIRSEACFAGDPECTS